MSSTIVNRHNLNWDDGILPYTTLRIILQHLSAVYSDIYVKGSEKKKILENLLCRDIISLESPKIKNLEKNRSLICSYHSRGFNCCALTKVQKGDGFLSLLIPAAVSALSSLIHGTY